MFTFGIGSILILFSLVVTLSLTLVIALGSAKPEARAFLTVTTACTIDLVLYLLYTASPQGAIFGEFFEHLTFISGLLLSSSFWYFCKVYVTSRTDQKMYAVLLVIIALLTPVFLFTELIIGRSVWMGEVSGVGIQIWRSGPGIVPIFEILFIGPFLAGIWLLYRKMRESVDPVMKKNLGAMILAFFVSFVPMLLFSLIFPIFGLIQYEWLNSLTFVLFLSIVMYSIIKFGQMNVKTVTAELLIILLIMILFVAIVV